MRERNSTASAIAPTIVLLAFLCWFPSAQSQVNSEKYQGMFLVGEFGEVCTMCEVIVLCETGDDAPAYEAIPAQGNFTVYHLQTRTFWSQMSTIWEWFIANFSSESLAQGHERPVSIYVINNGLWSAPEPIDAHIALEPPLLTFGDRQIDRTDRAWVVAAGHETIGYCQRLPLWDGLDVIAANSPEGVTE